MTGRKEGEGEAGEQGGDEEGIGGEEGRRKIGWREVKSVRRRVKNSGKNGI